MVGRVAPRTTIQPNESEVRLRFGGGLNTRASSDEINPREAAGGYNFSLDLGNTQMRPRNPFNLADTAPNAGRINGFAQLTTSTGATTTLIQAGTNVYSVSNWGEAWTLVGTVADTARLRGHRTHIWNLDDVVLISDLGGVEPVYQWDGTTFEEVYHNLAGEFRAKYIFVDNERAYYANVHSNGTDTPHVVVASAQSDYLTLSTNQVPSSGLSASDAWYLPTPDLRPINGLTGAFNVLVFSTLRGRMYQLLGSDATDFELSPLFYDSYADGMESLVNIGNDIVYGRQGRIESLAATDAYGDVETNDLSIKISDQISEYTGWTMAYSSRHQRVYCHPATESELWVFHKPLAITELSPWMKWTTAHSMGFAPTTMWAMLDPESGLEHVFCGDATGNVYRLEGDGALGDGGTTDIITSFVSKLESAPGHAQVYDCQGAIKFRPRTGLGTTLGITMQWQGESVYDTSITLSLPAAESGALYGGSDYYSDGSVYGSHFEGRLARERFGLAGQGNDVQVELQVTGKEDFEINEVYFGFRAAG